jgi:hypothetical protein
MSFFKIDGLNCDLPFYCIQFATSTLLNESVCVKNGSFRPWTSVNNRLSRPARVSADRREGIYSLFPCFVSCCVLTNVCSNLMALSKKSALLFSSLMSMSA